MTEMYLGLRDLETGKIKKTLPSSYLFTPSDNHPSSYFVTVLTDPETGKILKVFN